HVLAGLDHAAVTADAFLANEDPFRVGERTAVAQHEATEFAGRDRTQVDVAHDDVAKRRPAGAVAVAIVTRRVLEAEVPRARAQTADRERAVCADAPLLAAGHVDDRAALA